MIFEYRVLGTLGSRGCSNRGLEVVCRFAWLGYLWFDTAYEACVVMGICESLGKAARGFPGCFAPCQFSARTGTDNASRYPPRMLWKTFLTRTRCLSHWIPYRGRFVFGILRLNAVISGDSIFTRRLSVTTATPPSRQKETCVIMT